MDPVGGGTDLPGFWAWVPENACGFASLAAGIRCLVSLSFSPVALQPVVPS